MLTRSTSRDDTGSALVMAIIFVTVVGLAVTMGLGYSAVSLRASTRHYEPARDRLYASDAAMKAAVQSVIANPVNGRSNADGSCEPTRTYGAVAGESVTVVVCPRGATSLTPKGGASAWGLLTLATGSEDGLVVSGKGGLQIYGNTYANSAIDVSNESTLAIAGGEVKARGGCSGEITVDGVPVTDCTVATAPAIDPGYLPGITAPPAAGTGSCDSKTKIATLSAGTWTESTFDAAIGSCDVVWMQSGIHYLENIEWDVKYRVVAGDLAVAASALASTAAGAACKQGVNGATLVLGGTTTITLSGSTATLEVCGKAITQTSGNSVKLPLYGPTADIVTAGSSGVLTTSVNPTTSGSGTNWSKPSRAKTVDGSSATLSLSRGTSSRNLDITGFTGATAVPSAVRQLSLVARASSNRAATLSLTVLNASGGVQCPTVSGLTLPTSLGDVAATLNCSGPITTPLTVRAVVTALSSPSSTRSVAFDGVTVSYGTPAMKILGQSGCVVTPGGCAVLETKGNSNSIFLDGEVYLPKAKIAAQIPNLSTTFSTLGVVVRVLDVQVPASVEVQPVLAAENGNLNDGDVTVQALVNGDVWMTCRVTFTASGQKVTGSSLRGCTVPR